MTNQIATIIMDKLDALGEKQNSYVITSSLLGAFRTSQDTSSEFMNLIRQKA